MTTVLFVDNDPHIRLLCQEELQDEGYQVVLAGSAREILDLMESSDPDVVVLELLLPDMSGMEALRIIKDTRHDTPVIFYSTYTLPATGLGPKADGAVLKSHNTQDLKEAVRNVVQRWPRKNPSRPAPRRCHSA